MESAEVVRADSHAKVQAGDRSATTHATNVAGDAKADGYGRVQVADRSVTTRTMNSARDIRLDGPAKMHLGDSYSIVNNYLDSNRHHANSVLDETHREKARIEFLRRVQTSPYEDRKNRNPKRADGTCEWFTTHGLFQNWREEMSAMLWVSADPGCGKSVLARYLSRRHSTFKHDQNNMLFLLQG